MHPHLSLQQVYVTVSISILGELATTHPMPASALFCACIQQSSYPLGVHRQTVVTNYDYYIGGKGSGRCTRKEIRQICRNCMRMYMEWFPRMQTKDTTLQHLQKYSSLWNMLFGQESGLIPTPNFETIYNKTSTQFAPQMQCRGEERQVQYNHMLL